jgi:hypothetical protein
MKAHERQEAFQFAVQLLLATLPVPPRHVRYDPLLWSIQQMYLPHGNSLCDYNASSHESESTMALLSCDLEFAGLLYNAAWYVDHPAHATATADILKVHL